MERYSETERHRERVREKHRDRDREAHREEETGRHKDRDTGWERQREDNDTQREAKCPPCLSLKGQDRLDGDLIGQLD